MWPRNPDTCLSLYTLPPNYNFSSLLKYLALPPSSSHSVDDLALYYSEKREKMNRRDHSKVHTAHHSPVSVLLLLLRWMNCLNYHLSYSYFMHKIPPHQSGNSPTLSCITSFLHFYRIIPIRIQTHFTFSHA